MGEREGVSWCIRRQTLFVVSLQRGCACFIRFSTQSRILSINAATLKRSCVLWCVCVCERVSECVGGRERERALWPGPLLAGVSGVMPPCFNFKFHVLLKAKARTSRYRQQGLFIRKFLYPRQFPAL